MKVYKRYADDKVDSRDLPPKILNRVNRYISEKDRRLSMAGYSRLVDALQENGISAESVYFTESGKPKCGGCSISVSHSGGLAVCCISQKSVGIDAERIRPIRKRERYKLISRRDSELINCNDGDLSLRFLTVWTMKEAYKKAADCEWSVLSEVDFFEDGKPVGEYNGYRFETEIYGEYVITVCEKC